MKAERITSDSFREFGKLAVRPDGPPLAEDETFAYWSDVVDYEIMGETEVGYCTVNRRGGNVVAWMERHDRSPELLIPVDRPFVLPVMSDDGDVRAFRAEPGEAVLIGQGVWHSACKPVGGDAATYFVIFRRGTPHEDVIKRDIEPIEIFIEPND